MAAVVQLAQVDQASAALVEGAVRWLSYLGLVMLAGTVVFMTWVWPDGARDRTLRWVISAGWVCTVVATVAALWLGSAASSAESVAHTAAAQLVRLALLSLAVGFGPDLLPVRLRAHPLVVGAWVLGMVESYVLASDAWTQPWRAVKLVATTGHLLSAVVWLGGLLALAVVLVPRAGRDELHSVVPRFSRLATFSIATLVVTGTVHAMAVAGSVRALVTSEYGVVLGIKVLVFGAALLLGNEGRRYGVAIVRGRSGASPAESSERGLVVFAVAIGAEFAVATVVLAVTALLVHVAPLSGR